MSLSLGGKLFGVAIAAGAASPALFTNDLTTPVVGVGVTTVAGAVLGTYAAIGLEEEPRPRGKMFSLAISAVIIASMSTGVIPRAMGWTWADPIIEGGMAGLAAVACYSLLPPAMKRAKGLISEVRWSTFLGFWKSRKGVTPGMDDAYGAGAFPSVPVIPCTECNGLGLRRGAKCARCDGTGQEPTDDYPPVRPGRNVPMPEEDPNK